MKGIAKYKRSAMSIAIIVGCIFFSAKCVNREEQDKAVADHKNTGATQFTGSSKCAGCHKNIYESHINTAHFHTSEIASEKSIKGSFDSGRNTFSFSNGGMIKMEKRAEGFYQLAYVNGVERLRQRFDIVFGSGTKGQSYATWAGNKLLQLPITYFTSEHQWCNSPGNPNKIAINRLVTSRCLECHSTFVQKISGAEMGPDEFDKSTMVLGVDCEKCHGPAAKHVAFQTENPNEAKARYIINPSTFTRLQSLDMCTLCHGGRLQKSKPSFEFTAGDKLSDYFHTDTLAKDPDAIDVHGNQYGLLAASKCFRQSQTLTCMSCHNPHANEKGNVVLFSQRCMNCHNDKHANAVICTLTATLGTAINSQCTNCHMPEQASRAIAVLLQGRDTLTPAFMHTHLIKSYPAETQKILATIKAPARTANLRK